MFFFVAAMSVAALSIFSGGQAASSGLVARQTYQGQGTYYGTGLGACGITSSDSDYVVAVSAILYDNYPGAGPDPTTDPICGKSITATYPATGASVTVTVVERCVSCQTYDLNFSPAAFIALAGNLGVGRINIDWQYN